MKKGLLFLMVILVATFAAKAQTVITLGDYDLVLNTSSGGSAKMSVAYNPAYGLYYCGSGGGSSSPVMVFNTAGTLLQTISCNFDDRGIYYNSNTGRIEGNAYGTQGYGYYPLNGSGLITGDAVSIVAGMNQPDGQSCGSYNSLNNEVVFFLGNTFYFYSGSGTSLGSLGITLPSGAGSMNISSDIAVQISGQELGILDYTNKKVYCYNRSSGVHTVTYILPASAPAAQYYSFSFANNHIWLSDGSQWYGYSLLPSQTITFDPLADKIYGDADFDPGATASSGLAVTYSSGDMAIATIISNKVHIVAAGTVTIHANQAGNGSWATAPQVSRSLNINKKTLSVTGATAANKVYDGATTAAISGGSLVGILGSDAVSLANATAGTFASAGIGTGKTVTTAMTLTGAASGNYTLTQPALTANITAKSLTVTGATAANKVYDGATTATISGGSLVGVVGSEVVSLANATAGTFATSGIGTGKTVTTAMTLTGAASGNYTLTQPTLTANITAKALTVTGATAANKVYDGATTATISGGSLVGIVGSEVVSLANATAGTFASAGIGTGKTVTTAMTLTGAASGNYTLTQPALTANITAKALTVTGATAANKVYDGATTATISGGSLVGVVGSDVVSLTTATAGTFTSAGIGTGKTVTSAMTLAGAASGNYTLTQPALTANITAKALTVTSATAANKVYDGATTATISGGSLVGIVGSEVVSLANATAGTFTTSGIGTGKTVTTAMTLTGAASGNYTLTQPTLTANITAKALTVTGATATNKIYDGTTIAGISGGILSGIVGSDDVVLATTTIGTFASANVGNGINVIPTMILAGAASGNYTLSQPVLSANITAKSLIVTDATAVNKVYDGSTFAGISGGTLSGIVGSDIVVLATATSGTFASANVGTAISVSPAMSLTGAASGNYMLTQPALTADITAKSLTVTGATATGKVYDGTTDATVSGGLLDGIVGSDDVTLADATLGTFSSAYAGTGITVTTAMILTGTASGNYMLTQPTLSADITAKPLSITEATAADKVYDGSADATISGGILDGIVGSDDVTLANDSLGMFASTNAGTGIIVTTAMTITGAAAENYMLIQQTLTASITAKAITVIDATVGSKVYDGTADATISGGILDGVVDSDDVTLVNDTSGIFTSTNAGTGITVTTVMTITGAAADNYMLTQPTLTADITAKTLTVTSATADDKVYDGTTDAVISGSILDGIVDSDDVTLANDSSGAFTSAGTGTGITVIMALTLTGADAENYTLTQPELTANITSKMLTVTAEDKSKTYGDANPELTVAYIGFAGAEDNTSLSTVPTATTTAMQYSNADTYDIVPEGGEASNYAFTYINGTLTVNKAQLDITAIDASREEGDVNPEFTLSYAGFKGTDDSTVIDVLPTASCIADATSTAGDYDIVLSDGSDNNYNLVLHDGILKITAVTGISTLNAKLISVYPNPAGDYVYINNLPEKTSVRIFNLLGELVRNSTSTNKTEKIDVYDLPPGVYIIKLSVKDFETVARFVKQ
jgi:hypothetical protein